MNIDQIKDLQRDLAGLGLYRGDIDGIWGARSQSAWAASMQRVTADASVSPELIAQLRRDEGEVLTAYPDHLGYLTIGIGRMIDKRKQGGITSAEAAYLLSNDIAKVDRQLREALPWADGLNAARRGALLNMAFQMGTTGLLAFKNTLALAQVGSYAAASANMLQSLWAKQTPARAARVARQMATGEWQ